MTSEYGTPSPCNLTETVCELYNRLGPARPSDQASHPARAAATVTYMVSKGLDAEWLKGVAVGVAMPIWEMIRFCQCNPSKGWSAEVYDFVGRPDWAVQRQVPGLGNDSLSNHDVEVSQDVFHLVLVFYHEKSQLTIG